MRTEKIAKAVPRSARFLRRNERTSGPIVPLINSKRVPAIAPGVVGITAAIWLSVAASCSPAAAQSIQLPIELMGAEPTSRTVQFEVSDTSAASRANLLLLRVHGLSYPNKASIQLNAGPVVPLNNSTVSVAAPGRNYGGIGGPVSNLSLSLPLAAGTVRAGANSIRFTFNGTDGLSTGYRVLEFNLADNSGRKLLPASTFVQEDPNTWQAPRNTPEDIAAGRNLWYNAPLRSSSLPNARMLQARCTDCHAHDGRDLKYFNYSNYAITERARFHGMSTVQGEQIASYIRSLPVPNPGRPWNPPYQPGEGTDSQPIRDWAAGAGLDAVLDRDADSLPHVFPDGVSRKPIERDGNLNLREIPVAFQMPDWNHWLPQIHPKDAWGTLFQNNNALKIYAGEGGGAMPWNLRQRLAANANYGKSKTGFYQDVSIWNDWVRGFLFDRRPAHPLYYDAKNWPADLPEKMHSTRLWQLVKLWELHEEFGLESVGSSVFGAKSEPRTWLSMAMWDVSPFELWIPRSLAVGISPAAAQPVVNGYSPANLYFVNSWFYLQLILNSSNGEKRHPFTPGALEYLYEHIRATSYLEDREPVRLLMAYAKSIQIRPTSDPMFAPDQGSGWLPKLQNPIQLGFQWPGLWDSLPQETKVPIMQAVLDIWVDKNRDYSPSTYPLASKGGYYDPQYVPPTPGTQWGYHTWNLLETFRGLGVNTENASAWAKTMWAGWPYSSGNPVGVSGLAFSPASLMGAGTTKLTVSLDGAAPQGGVTVYLKSNSGSVSVPTSVTVPQGATSTVLTLSAPAVTQNTTITVDATGGGLTRSATLSLAPLPVAEPVLGSFALVNTTVPGGAATTGTVTLNVAAPTGGRVVTLISGNPGVVSLPASVTIPAGSTSVSFSVNAAGVKTDTLVVLSAVLGGVTRNATLTVKAPSTTAMPTLSVVTVSPSLRTGGESATGKVMLNAAVPAGTGGMLVQLTSNNPAVEVPATVMVPEGEQSATFPISTVPVATDVTVTVRGEANGAAKNGVLTVAAPGLASIVLNRTSLTGGTTCTATVGLYGPAPKGGMVVKLESSNSSVVSLPATITIPEGAKSVVLPVSPNKVGSSTPVTLSATVNGVKKGNTLTVLP